MNDNWKFSALPYTSPDVEALQARYDALTQRAKDAQGPEDLLEVVRQPRALGQPFSLWSLQRLVDFMAEEPRLRVSEGTVRRALKASGVVLSRPQHKISSPDPEYQVKKND